MALRAALGEMKSARRGARITYRGAGRLFSLQSFMALRAARGAMKLGAGG
jgi:hypothetical protein